MFSKKIEIRAVGVIAAVLAAVGYWNISPGELLDKPVAQTDESAIDYYAINAHSVQFLPDGKLQYEMTADKVEHLKASEVTLVTTPDLHMYRGTEYPWQCRARVPRSTRTAPKLNDRQRGLPAPTKSNADDYQHTHDRVPAEAICADRASR
jgi:lipopolysaccharide export system protein LptC